jgi:hypothetical protein
MDADTAQLVTAVFVFSETHRSTLEEISRTFGGGDAVEEIKVRALADEKEQMFETVENANQTEPAATK